MTEWRSTKSERLSLLQRLADTDGISGFEEGVREVMRGELRNLCGEVNVDTMGNLIAVRRDSKPSAPRIMLASHMDEVGMIVKYVKPDGYIVFELSGLIDPSILPSQLVRIHTTKDVVHGVIGARAGHFAAEERSRLDPSSMWIDIGARSREEVTELGVRVGDFITYDRPFRISANGRYVFGKALDNRVGCTALIESLREIHDSGSSYHLYAVGTVMEEIGALGARVAANTIQPQVAIVLDGVPASDPIISLERSSVQVGQGPVIRKAEVRIPDCSVTPEWLVNLALQVAKEGEVPYQIDVSSAFFSDASAINISARGIPTIPILVPRRNSHTPAEIASVDDINNAIRLTSSLVGRIASRISSE